MGVSLVFAANIMGLDLALADLVNIVMIGTVLSIGAAIIDGKESVSA
jgi:Na+/H+-dicarboxylate symporter